MHRLAVQLKWGHGRSCAPARLKRLSETASQDGCALCSSGEDPAVSTNAANEQHGVPGLTGTALRVFHGPYCFVPRRVFVAIPRRSADVQVGVGSSGKHDPRPRVAHRRWESAEHRVERPENHPVRANRYGGARPILGVRVAVLCCVTKHVAETGCPIGWPRLPCHRVSEPLHPQLIDTHWGSANLVLIAGYANPSVRAFTKDAGDVSLMVHLCHRGISGDLWRV
jgi:hypothetical protein